MANPLESNPRAKGFKNIILPVLTKPYEIRAGESLYTIGINNGIRDRFEVYKKGISILDVFLSNTHVSQRSILTMTLDHSNSAGDLQGLKGDVLFVACYPPPRSEIDDQQEFQFTYSVTRYDPSIAEIYSYKWGIMGKDETYQALQKNQTLTLLLPSLNLPEKVKWVDTAAMYLSGHHPDHPAEKVSASQIQNYLLIEA